MRLPNGSEVMGAQPARVDLPLALSMLGPQNRERQNKSLLLGRIQRIFDDPAVLGGIWTCDPEYLRQDSTGQTAAAVGAPVGLVYDQSREMALGPNLVLNGNFSVGTGWSCVSSSISEGKAVFQNVIYSRISQNGPTLVAGNLYRVCWDMDSISSGKIQMQFQTGSTAIGKWFSSSGLCVDNIVANSGNNRFYLTSDTIGSDAVIDNLSVNVLLGNHATQTTTAAKPTLKRWPSSDIYWCLTETDTTALTVTFPSSLGSSCYRAVAGVSGIREYFGQTIGTTLNLVDAPLFGQVVLNRAPTDHERRLILAWLRYYVPMAQPSLAAVQAIYAAGAVGGVWLPTEGALFATNDTSTLAIPGGTIGLVYGQSRGTSFGQELVTNGDGSSITGWTARSGATLSSVSGRLRVTCGTANYYAAAISSLNTTIGNTYVVSINTFGGTAPSYFVTKSDSNTSFSVNRVDVLTYATGDKYIPFFTFIATATTTYLWLFLFTDVVGQYSEFDNISVREVPSNPALQSNASYRPTLRQAPESRVLFSDVSPASPALTATFASTVGATSTVIEVTPTGVKKRVASVSTTFNLLTQYKYWGGTVLVNRATTDAEDAAILALMDPFVPGLGAQVISNPDFDYWASDNPVGWVVLNENANNYVTQNSGSARIVSDNTALIALRTGNVLLYESSYFMSVDIRSLSGSIYLSAGGAQTTSGVKTVVLTPPNSSTQYFQIQKNGVCDASIESIYAMKIL